MVRGDKRATIGTGMPGTGQALWIHVEAIEEPEPSSTANELAREYRAVLENILLSRGARRMAERLRDVTDPSQIADLAGYSPDLSLDEKLKVLETIDVTERLRFVLAAARDTLADLTLRDQIKTSVEEGMEKTQREFLLRRQLEAIRKELGEMSDDGTATGPDGYRERLEAAGFPETVHTAVAKEIDRLERTSEQSPEHGWIQTWLDTVFELPWGKESEDRLDIGEAGRILDEDHDGLRDVKDRILEHLAVRKLQAERGLTPLKGSRGAGAILALVGPPGRRQDLARRIGRSGSRAILRAGRARWREGRGRDQRPSPYVCRRPAGTAREGAARSRDHEPGHLARRGGQARLGLPRRSFLRLARSARPGAEPHIPRPLSRGRAGPVEGAVHRDRRTWWTPSRRHCSTGWRSSASTATRRTRSWP